MPPVSPDRISLPDRYRVVRFLASGGMATVWEAHDSLLGRDVAVKVLASHLVSDERARRRFGREARAAAGLSSHPNVVTVYDFGSFDERVFMVMEIMRGGTVADRTGRVSRDVALEWLRQAGAALDTAHAAGIVHRDVKPGNLLLDARDRLAVADFGIARLAWEDQLTVTGQVLGTAAYLSPEQALGEKATAASDRYALAVVAYELLAGARPFESAHFAATARAHVEDTPPRASVRAADRGVTLPRAVDGVLERGLAKEPRDRWASCAALVDALASSSTSVPTTRRRGRWRRQAAAGGGAAGLGGAAGAAGPGDAEGASGRPTDPLGGPASAGHGRSPGGGAARNDDATAPHSLWGDGDAAADDAARRFGREARGGEARSPRELGADSPGRDLAGDARRRDTDLSHRDTRRRTRGEAPRRDDAPSRRDFGRGEPGPRRDVPTRDGGRRSAERRRRSVVGPLLFVLGALAVLAAAGGYAYATRDDAESPPRAETTPTATPSPRATSTPTPEATPTATPSPTDTPTPAPTETATPEPETPGAGEPPSGDPSKLQAAGHTALLNGDVETALTDLKAAIDACGGSAQVDPCAYAMYDYAAALLAAGRAEEAAQVLEQRLARFDDQNATVRDLLKKALQGGGPKGGAHRGPDGPGPRGNGPAGPGHGQ
ncbi:MAG TPA: protein kinase [Solirubrobacter sp.]|nr:protein kinase [Solirubrobacter sp.]